MWPTYSRCDRQDCTARQKCVSHIASTQEKRVGGEATGGSKEVHEENKSRSKATITTLSAVIASLFFSSNFNCLWPLIFEYAPLQLSVSPLFEYYYFIYIYIYTQKF